MVLYIQMHKKGMLLIINWINQLLFRWWLFWRTMDGTTYGKWQKEKTSESVQTRTNKITTTTAKTKRRKRWRGWYRVRSWWQNNIWCWRVPSRTIFEGKNIRGDIQHSHKRGTSKGPACLQKSRWDTRPKVSWSASPNNCVERCM